MVLLEAEKVYHRFGGLVALNDVSFKVERGQIKAIIGPNGAGKTTLFNIVSGLIKPTSGVIRFEGKEITHLKPFEIAALGISRTFQNVSLFQHMSVLENVLVGQHLHARSGMIRCALRSPAQRKEEKSMIEYGTALLAEVGLTERALDSAGALSLGQRRLVELARALATKPRLLLLDEPASGLNTKETDNLADRLLQIRDRGITLLMVEHDMSLVMDIADEVLVLDFGVKIAEGPPSRVRTDPKVIAVYLGEKNDPASD
ncbi:MAG: ABC transporter ATP-binding protein, partial [Verrucomicrobiae bacterium]|nr:ABC transporter ATP-binding protein [Verrucomicrobiae bacterium]